MELTLKIIVILTMLQRIYELRLSKNNEAQLIDKGAKIIPEKNYIFMVLLHSSWIVLLLYLAFYQPIMTSPLYFSIGLILFFTGQALRILAIKTLGERWSTRIVVLPKAPVIKKGIFNFIRHPNYLGVILEIAFLPIAFKAFSAALIFSLINGVILYFRIKLEESSLSEFNNYFQEFKSNG